MPCDIIALLCVNAMHIVARNSQPNGSEHVSEPFLLFKTMKTKQMYPWRTLASFLVVLFSMPLGHALMIIMEHTMNPSAMHVAGFLLGLVGLVMVIVGVFVKGDTRQTIWGLIGGLLFWTGWVEFLFLY